MKNKFLSLLLLLVLSFSCVFGVTACDVGGGDSSSTAGGNSSATGEPVDYVSDLKLDMNSETLKAEATVKMYIDGDTTHFYVDETVSPTGVLKARYIGINTPESTGRIEPWGKTASNYTKDKLLNATSIMLETDSTTWEKDSTGDRHLVWVWYKTSETAEYRNLNLEILQEGLAIPSNTGATRYGTQGLAANMQAKDLKIKVYATTPDPDFYYGEAIEMTLKELRLNIQDYNGSKVAFEGVATYQYNDGYYIENYDEISDTYFGIYVYLGKGNTASDQLKPGNKVRIVGSVTNFNGSWQVSGLEYFPQFDPTEPPNPNNTVNLFPGQKFDMANLETSATTFNGNKTITVQVQGEDDEWIDQEKTFKYSQLALQTTISMKNLQVIDVWTTTNPSSKSKGAMTITCQVGGETIKLRTLVLYDENNELITEADVQNKTLDIQGVIEYYSAASEDGDPDGYQIKILSWDHITVK